MLAEPKAVLAGVMVEVSFAEFSVLMPISNVERAPSQPSGSWEFVAIVKTSGSCEKVGWNKAARKSPMLLRGG